MKRGKEDPAFRPLCRLEGTGGTTPESHDGTVPRACRMEGLQDALERASLGAGTPAGQSRPGKLGRSSLDRPGSTLNEEGARPQPALPRGLDGTQHAQLKQTVRRIHGSD